VNEPIRIIETVAQTVQPARWRNRVIYGWAVTAALLGMLGGAVFHDKPHGLIFWLLGLIVCLVMLAPTAEQFGKWLAQVAAIKNGVNAPPDRDPDA
jgi:F0F1-type ATP synthase assembly protein I